MENFQKVLESKVIEIERIIGTYLPKEEGFQKVVLEAMNYSVLAGGKRLRPMLMLETYRMFGGRGKEVEPFMAALEMIHTYSLVHDDLPAMDNDEYRRGRKTTHVVYGEAFAILAGDALLNFAFETALKAFPIQTEEPERLRAEQLLGLAQALEVLSTKAGIYGMIGGQTADIEAEGKGGITTEQLLFIHENKTAALIQAAMMIGAILAGAGVGEVQRIEKCAYNIGIAFQIQDDILDVIGNQEELGKPIGSDEKNHKQTYVTLNGLEESKEQVRKLSEEAVQIIDSFGGDSTFLKELILSLIHRSK
ncbi:MAG: polyprenyl synthetase family protein [Lachnospiraceae bacterium]|nr:polyprenyl synthetase family protein [Lachnospiraceae bacterium]